MTVKTPWGPIGYFVYKRTYARRLYEVPDSPTEEFDQTIDRVLSSARDQLGVQDLKDEMYYDKAKKMLMQLKGSVAGRFLWQLGTRTVDDLGLMSLQNCAFNVIRVFSGFVYNGYCPD